MHCNSCYNRFWKMSPALIEVDQHQKDPVKPNNANPVSVTSSSGGNRSLNSFLNSKEYHDLRYNDAGNRIYENVFLPIARLTGVECGQDDYILRLIAEKNKSK